MITTTQMQLVDINKLIPYVNNARTHSPEQITKLRSSLREFGFINPVLIGRCEGRRYKRSTLCIRRTFIRGTEESVHTGG